jgi:glycosyltransferase involved in cell wall biosynthesis
MTRSIRLSLVLPAFNEANGIAEAIADADASLARLGCDYEIIVVDDGSQDGTAERVREWSAFRDEIRLVQHAENLGYGAALRTGFEAARFELVAFTDADGQFDLEDLADLIDLTRRHPIAVGWRVDRQDPWRRRFLSRGYNLLARTFLGTGIRDVDCALKVFRREALAYLLPESRGFFVNTEMICRARQFGWSIGEIGVRHRPRRNGSSKVSLVEVPKTFATLARFWWKNVVWAKPLPKPIFARPMILPMPKRPAGSPLGRAA